VGKLSLIACCSLALTLKGPIVPRGDKSILGRFLKIHF
jgi:hypothetical protein